MSNRKNVRLTILLFAVKNLKRKTVRSVLLILAVAVVAGTLFAATVFISSMQNALRIGTYRLGADVLVVPEKNAAEAKNALLAGEPTAFYMDKEVMDGVRAVEGVQRVSPQLFIKPSSFTCCYNVDVFLVAFDPASDFTVTPWLEKNLAKTLGGNDVLTGREIPVIAGDTLAFYGTGFNVAGTMAPTGMKFFDLSVFMTMDAAYGMAENSRTNSMQPLSVDRNKISAVLVQAQEGFTPERLAIKIEHAVSGVRALASDEVVSTVRKQLGGLIKGTVAISSIVWILALLLMGFAFYMIVNERQREIGLLRAMGATRDHVFRLIISEAVLVSAIGGILGLFGGAALLLVFAKRIVRSLNLPYLLPSAPILTELFISAVVFSVCTGLIASLLPAFNASRMEPYEAIRKGD